MDNEQKSKVLRYAELARKKGGSEAGLTTDEEDEIAKLYTELVHRLGMSHNSILEFAIKNLISEDRDGC